LDDDIDNTFVEGGDVLLLLLYGEDVAEPNSKIGTASKSIK